MCPVMGRGARCRVLGNAFAYIKDCLLSFRSCPWVCRGVRYCRAIWPPGSAPHVSEDAVDVALGLADAVAYAALPDAYGAVDGVGGVVVRLDDGEHLARLLGVVAVLEGVAALVPACLEDGVALAHEHGRDLEQADILAVDGAGVAPTLKVGDGIDKLIPVGLAAFGRRRGFAALRGALRRGGRAEQRQGDEGDGEDILAEKA